MRSWYGMALAIFALSFMETYISESGVLGPT
jgi:hypothetical protein